MFFLYYFFLYFCYDLFIIIQQMIQDILVLHKNSVDLTSNNNNELNSNSTAAFEKEHKSLVHVLLACLIYLVCNIYI